jgi:hypothetical protein
VDQNTVALDEWQSRMDDRLREAFARLDVIGTLRLQVDNLEERVSLLETELAARKND